MAHVEHEANKKTASKAWLSILSETGEMLLKPAASRQWYFVAGSLGGVAVGAWPAKSEKVGTVQIFWPDTSISAADVEIFVITDLTKYEAWPFQWRGPSSIRLVKAGIKTRGVCALPVTAKPLTLYQAAAHYAFGKLPKTTCQNIAKSMPMPNFDSADNLHELLFKMVQRAFPTMKQEEVLVILRQRMAVADSFLEMFETPEMMDLLEENEDQGAVAKMATEVVAAQDEQQAMLTEFEKLVHHVGGRGGGGGGAAASSSRGGASFSVDLLNPLGGRVYREVPAPGDSFWKGEALSEFLPPGDAKLFFDKTADRAEVFFIKARKARSFAWQLYTREAAGRMCLREAWNDFKRKTGKSCPFKI